MSDVRIWGFGALAPVTEGDRVHRLLRDSRRYYNKLVEIERRRYNTFSVTRKAWVPDLAEIEEEYARTDDQIGELIREVKKLRLRVYKASKERTRSFPEHTERRIEELREKKGFLQEQAKPLRKAFREQYLDEPQQEYKRRTKERAAGAGPRIKSRINAEVLDEMLEEPWSPVWKAAARSDACANADLREARANSGLPPGTYLLVEDAFNRAKKSSLPRPPGFRRFNGEGRIGVQLHKTCFADLLAGTSKMQLVPDPKPGLKGRSELYYIAKLRVGSNPDRSPIWADIPVKLHRLPPNDAEVKWAWLLVRRQGDRIKYQLQLNLKHSSFSEPKRPAGTGDGGHVRIGWGQTPQGVRVANWDTGEVVVPREVLEASAFADKLSGYAADHLNTAARVMRLWMYLAGNQPKYWERGLHSDIKRKQLREACTAYAEHCFTEPGVRILWSSWKQDRQLRGRDLFCSLEEVRRWLQGLIAVSNEKVMAWWLYLWAQKDAHLKQWAADQKKKAERRRNHFFRDQAIRLATQYETLSVDKYSIAELKRLPVLSRPGDSVNETSQYNAQVAAPGLFRETLLEVMGDRCKKTKRPQGTEAA